MFAFHSSSSHPASAAAFPDWISKEPYASLFAKWGFALPGEWSLHQYTYTHVPHNTFKHSTDDGVKSSSEAATSAPSAVTDANSTNSSVVSAGALRFHHGMATDFLQSLFSSPAVRAQLMGGVVEEDSAAVLSFRPLTTQWATLGPLRQALVKAKVVRQAKAHVEENEAKQEEKTADDFHSGGVDATQFRLPTVKCAEELLPHGEVISDELRALFLQAHSRSCHYGSSPSYSSYAAATFAGGIDDKDFEEEEEEEDAWGAMSGAKLPLRQLRAVFNREDRAELLYHLVWRLIAGSGPLNQFEDDAAVYLDVARQLYRSLVTSLHVREVVVSSDGKTAEKEEEEDVTALETPAKAVQTTLRYEAVVDALVYEVVSAPGLRLFPSSDGVTPSNLNYCYVVVNPSEQTVNVWYHHC